MDTFLNNEEPFQIRLKSKEFFQQPTIELAKQLLGCLLIKESLDGVASGYIVETEAYMGPEDKAAHSFQNRRTKRTEVLFGEAGIAYTYRMHTHCLVNVVSGEKEKPEAILIRAIEPFSGIPLMETRRKTTVLRNLTNGPGKLTKALGITMDDYGRSFQEPPIMIAEGVLPDEIASGKRIGIENSGEAKDYPWRFWVKGNPYVSRHQREI
ncbi:DNA-3-methyladenine glycosylase [Robertmurraya yapensis]|uniref:DNA-3-methyladenine glycosylase n=2 Tax=Bacillaceae TaxID=186817 RepID=A0ACC6SDE3_9BACI|nr:DNA-3-methyladenine glycosylase [Bacillus yapensis]RTR27874.1 DNA-3-methyladenine glycosylase [Bacillus yapensis]TKS94277.1 DNA-3-methyladenine glycosylase [Bacillus yapensis]